jgi:hypothetical protein
LSCAPESAIFCSVVYEPRFRYAHGDHACVFYRSEDTRAEVMLSFMIEGLRKGEKCLCAETLQMQKRLKHELRAADFDVEKEIASGALEFLTEEAAYLPNGAMHAKEQSKLIPQAIQAALRAGFRGLRTAGDVSWASGSPTHTASLLEYELLASKIFPGNAAMGLCLYPVKDFAEETLSTVLKVHNLNVIDPSQPSPYSWIQIRHKGFIAEVITDKSIPNSDFSFIVRPEHSDDVLKIGNAPTFEMAREKAEHLLRSITSNIKLH